MLPVRGREVKGRPRVPGAPIVAGFYVTWDDNSLDALLHHADDLDWVVCECAWLGPHGNGLRLRIDRRVGVTIASAVPDVKKRPQIFLMVSNFDSATKRWDPVGLRHLLTNPASRALALQQLTDSVSFYGLGGVTIDFEEEPQELTEPIATFVADLRRRLAPMGKLVTQAASVNDSDHQLARFAQVNDYLFLMLYDEHFGKTGDPGPIASQQWFVERMRHMLRFVPPQKAIPIVGAYGYDWNDGDSTTNGQQLTFQEIMSVRAQGGQEGAALRFDDAQPVRDVDRSRFHRSSRVVSRRDHRVQPDAGGGGDRNRGDGHLAHGLRGSRDLARDRQGGHRFIGGAAERHPTRLRRRDGGERRDSRSVRVARTPEAARCASIP